MFARLFLKQCGECRFPASCAGFIVGGHEIATNFGSQEKMGLAVPGVSSTKRAKVTTHYTKELLRRRRKIFFVSLCALFATVVVNKREV